MQMRGTSNEIHTLRDDHVADVRLAGAGRSVVGLGTLETQLARAVGGPAEVVRSSG